jgi:hypothetical protein
MATVRIQVRRGTASQWTSANPILAAGELGVESDTNLFKFGNGTDTWTSLAYANNSDVAISEISQDAINSALTLGSGLAKSYDDGANTITISVIDSYFTELAQDAANSALVAGDGISKAYNDAANTITLDVDIESNGGLKVSNNKLTVDDTVVQKRLANVSDTEIGYLDGVTSSIQGQLNSKAEAGNIMEAAQDALNEALVAGEGIKKTYDDAGNSLTLDLDLANGGGLKINVDKLSIDTDVVIDKSSTQTLTHKNLSFPKINDNTVSVSGTEINYLTGLTKNISDSYVDVYNDSTDYTDLAVGSLNSTLTNDYVPTSLVGQADGIATLNSIGKIPMSQINLIDAELNGDTTAENLSITGNLTFNGTATTINSTNLNITDPLIYLAKDNPANTRDLGFVSSFTAGGTYQHTGLVRDHAAGSWVLFKGVTDEPTSTVNFSQATPDGLTVGALIATTLNVGDVSNTEIGYLNNVTAPIQTQIDAKAPLVSPTFTGIVTLPDQTITSAMIANATIATADLADGSVTSVKIADGTITGTDIATSTIRGTNIADNAISQAHLSDDSVGTNEIGGLAVTTGKIADLAVTAAKLADASVETAKIADSAITSAKIANGTIVASDIADGAVTSAKILDGTIATSDLADSAVTSAKIANNTILDDDINSSAAIGWTKLGISTTVSSAEIGYVAGTTSSIQTQLDAKLPYAGGTLTGDLTLRGNPTTNNMAATKAYVDAGISSEVTNRNTAIATEASSRDTAIGTAVSTHNAVTAAHGATGAIVGTTNAQTLTNKTLTSPVINTPTGITKSDVGLANVDNTTDSAKPVSTATQTALDLKAPIASPTFTGTVSGITKSMVGLGNVDNTADSAKPVSTATQTALDAKLASATAATTYAPIASPTFTGTVSGVTKSMVGLGNVDNTADSAKPVSTATQTALDLKATLASPALTGTPTAPTPAAADNSTKVATTAYADRAASNAAAALVASAPAALDTLNELAAALGNDASFSTTISNSIGLKAPIASPTFTGTVSGVTKSMVGLGNVDNTADSAKPVSTATQTALDLKLAATTAASTYAPLASPTFTGTVTLPSGTVTSAMILDGTIVDADINASAAIAQSKISGLTTALSAKAPIDAPTFTGTVTVSSSGVAFTDGTQTKEGVPSRTTILSKTADYTLTALTERDNMIELNSSSPITISVPTDATLNFPIGTTIDLLRVGTGTVTVAAVTSGTTTINATPGFKLRAQWSSATLMKRAANTWVLLGDLMA